MAGREKKVAVRSVQTERERQFRAFADVRGLRLPANTHIDRTLRGLSSFFSGAFFREETARRHGLMQGVDPRARLLAVLWFIFSLSIAKRFPTLASHAVLPVAAAALSRIRLREFMGAGFLFALLFSLLMSAPSLLNLFYEGTVVYPLLALGEGRSIGPYSLPAVVGITREGLLTAATFLLRVLPSAAAALLLTLTTRWADLLRSLRFLRLPPLFLQVGGMAVRYVHALLRASEDMHHGKKSRMVCRMPAGAEQAWAGSRLAASWERSLHLMEEVSGAMKARGFTGEAKFPAEKRLRGRDWGFVAAVVLFCTGAHLL
ncbi:MAG: energy-coupling factor transporter transmembrane component T family protein [Deltaproteobacteria bacterium]